MESAVQGWREGADESLDSASALGNLAALYRVRARYRDAAALLERAVKIRFRILGNDDPKLPTVLRNLALTYQDLGDLKQARVYIMRSLATLDARGDDASEDRASSLTTLGCLLQSEGDLAGSEAALRKALAIEERLYGSDDPRILGTLNNLALTYRLRDNLVMAEALYRRALDNVFDGRSSKPAAATINNLGSVMFERGRWKEARDYYTRALSIWEKTLGEDSPEVSAVLTNLAVLYQSRGALGKAAGLMDRAMRIDEKVFPADHPRIANDLVNAGSIAAARGRLVEAEQLVMRSAAMFEKSLPPTHPDLGAAMAHLADIYRTQGRLEDAEKMYGRALRILMSAWGPEDRRLLPSLERYAVVLRDQKEFAEAAKMDVRAMRIRVTTALRQQ